MTKQEILQGALALNGDDKKYRVSFAVKYLLRKCEIFANANVGKFHFTLRPAGAIFHNFCKEIILHSA